MTLIQGFILATIAGVSMGLNILPMKWARAWKFENFWFFYTLFSFVLVPAVLAFVLCPHLVAVYSELPSPTLARLFLVGGVWGFSMLGAGLCTHRLGFAVSGSILNGIGTACGTLVPLMAQHRELAMRTSGVLLFTGTAVALAGVALCGWAGYKRERRAKEQGRRAGFSQDETAMSQAEPTRRSYYLMVALAIASGLLTAILNIALAYSGDLFQRVRAAGAAPQWAPLSMWPVALLGGSAVNFVYSSFLLTRNRTWGRFRASLKEYFNPLLAGLMWMGGVALYSSATTYLGTLGVSIGFALFTVINILCLQLAAVGTGEWLKVGPAAYRAFAAGVASLVAAVILFGAANSVAH
jgi:L-rhamnose-H+ transport protein